MAVQEIPASAEKQETPLPASSSSNSLPLTPITTIDANPMYQDSPLLSSDQLEQLLGHLPLDPFPFFDPSASNQVPLPPAAAGSLVSSINGETSSSSYSVAQQEPPLLFFNNTALVSSINGETSSSSSSSVAQQEPPLLFLNNTSRYYGPFVWVNRPPPQFYKLNVAVVPGGDERITFLGLGVVVRDHFAVVHQAMSLVWDHNIHRNLDIAEFYMYSVGIGLCINHFPRLVAEAEGHALVRRYQREYDASRFDSFEARIVHRSDNRLARAFAKMALHFDHIFWAPEQIVQFWGSLRLTY